MNRLIVALCVLVSITTASPLNGRIVGGEDAVLGQFPYQASLRANGTHRCGGAIVNNRWIVTAANCVAGFPISSLAIAVGSIRLNDPEARVYQIERVEVHENYVAWNLQHDIGLIRVSEDIEMGNNVQPVPLHTADIGVRVYLNVSGWGDTSFPGGYPAETLQFIEQRSISHDECQNIHWTNEIFETVLCTHNSSGEGSCFGDSGSPQVLNGQLTGIVSWGYPCAFGYPDVFTRVSSYVDWIQERINN